MDSVPVPDLPPAPSDLWPKVPSAKATRSTGEMLTLHVPIFAERPLLSALSRSVHSEMSVAGEWAARGGDQSSPQSQRQRKARELSRLFAEDAARLLSLYTAAYASARQTSEFQLRPEILREHATLTFRRAVRNEWEKQIRPTPQYNDSLYETVKPGAPKTGQKPRRPR